jgi:hypothetical protein
MYLHPIFVGFSRFLKKLFMSRCIACPIVVPGLSHAFCGTRKLLKKGHLAIVFDSVPLIFNKSAPQPDTKGEQFRVKRPKRSGFTQGSQRTQREAGDGWRLKPEH